MLLSPASSVRGDRADTSLWVAVGDRVSVELVDAWPPCCCPQRRPPGVTVWTPPVSSAVRDRVSVELVDAWPPCCCPQRCPPGVTVWTPACRLLASSSSPLTASVSPGRSSGCVWAPGCVTSATRVTWTRCCSVSPTHLRFTASSAPRNTTTAVSGPRPYCSARPL